MRIRVGVVLALLVGCSSGSKHAAAPADSQPAPAAPAPAPSDPAPGAAVTPPTAPSGGGAGHAYCIGGADGQPSECASQAARHRSWHRHGYLESSRNGECYECWDEESEECETTVPKTQPFKFIGPSSCEGRPPHAATP